MGLWFLFLRLSHYTLAGRAGAYTEPYPGTSEPAPRPSEAQGSPSRAEGWSPRVSRIISALVVCTMPQGHLHCAFAQQRRAFLRHGRPWFSLSLSLSFRPSGPGFECLTPSLLCVQRTKLLEIASTFNFKCMEYKISGKHSAFECTMHQTPGNYRTLSAECTKIPGVRALGNYRTFKCRVHKNPRSGNYRIR